MTPEQANAVYDILVAECDAPNHPDGRDRFSFVNYMTEESRWSKEYRFCGSLGFGGKLRQNDNRDGLPYVDCYQEDETRMRRAAISTANERIRALFTPPSTP